MGKEREREKIRNFQRKPLTKQQHKSEEKKFHERNKQNLKKKKMDLEKNGKKMEPMGAIKNINLIYSKMEGDGNQGMP